MAPTLGINGITKFFPGVKALESVHLDVNRGEIVALVGENGAGKSTLMKILAGIHRPDAGTICIDGSPVQLPSPREAARHGIAIIHQELEIVETLDVAGNIFLGREFTWGGAARLLDARRMWAEAAKLLERLDAPFSPRTPVARLSLAHKQLVEIARALSLNAKLLLMDEPTSSLTAAETDRLLQIVRELKRQGVSVVYISHRLAEIGSIADRAVVLRDGKNAGELTGSDITHEKMIRLMVGRDLNPPSPASRPDRMTETFHIQGFRTSAYPRHEVSFTAHGGEILGFAGLIGAGRSELARAMFGVDRPEAGTVACGSLALNISSPRDAIAAGIYLVPEDRRELGLITAMTVRENITLPALSRYASRGLIRTNLETAAARQACERLQIKTPSIETPAATLSGGNQQKVALAKWLSLSPRLIIFDEPTRGIDVGAKAEIHRVIRRLADQGVAVIMISSDMEEILGNSDRVAVMREGRITGFLERNDFSEEAIMRLAVA